MSDRQTGALVSSSKIANVQKQDLSAWEPNSSDCILIIAPHPDDEVLAAGGVIATALKSRDQSKLRVVVATNGDASYATAFSHGSHLITKENFRSQAVMRQRESLTALASLGLDDEQVHFWGFPDRGLASLWQIHWDSQYPYRSPTTGYSNSAQALNSPVLPFTGVSLLALFQRELMEFNPTIIIMPHPQDNHSDHSALAIFTLLAAKHYHAQSRLPPPMYLAYWMWRQAKPWLTGARPHDFTRLPARNDATLADMRRFALAPDVLEQKALALQRYPSQKFAAGQLFRKASRSSSEIFTLLRPAF